MSPASGAQVLRYTAFSTDPAGGNPAGVVLDATGLDDDDMLRIAAEVGHSETAFLTGGTGRTYEVRYFSPLTEVPFCGHATVAAAAALTERVGPGELTFATRSGTVPVTTTVDAAGTARATLTSVEPSVHPVTDADLDEALAALGWRSAELDPALPPGIAYAGARHLVLAAGTRARLADLDYDFDRLGGLSRSLDLATVQLVWREPDTLTFHVRNPFPVGGVVEDPATGAAAAAFGAYLRHLGQAGPSDELLLLQGEDMGRPSTIEVRFAEDDARVRVSGFAVRCAPEA
ncbi:PhzF family phenazine biosynthesis protein [Streptomyces sp. SHP 1-2]|uniref:PhzF family phenazine biosynthesis protein n=1 Tax=Streptomyces sp. SHP 1-2 TaxID=2769489 RepID=UPI0022375411|nr:PhzF family phenazine biosynthesis protein [Streptomyces sp. SHP 1-2]MCW5251376.1 PhzF family phenazine biosynthesis isomerase [Streptomyces sp. SHP 1-2]